jgi:hypothetical protein
MEIGKNIKRKNIDFSKTIDFFKDHIDGGGFLGENILEKIDLKKGSFFIFLPELLNLDNIYNFSQRPINSLMEKENDSNLEVCKFIKTFLAESDQNFCLCEDVIQSPKDPHIEEVNVGLHFYNNHIYYCLSNKNTLEEINRIIKRTDNIWHSLIVLSRKVNFSQNLRAIDFSYVCQNAQYILTSVYDGEKFLIWEK